MTLYNIIAWRSINLKKKHHFWALINHRKEGLFIQNLIVQCLKITRKVSFYEKFKWDILGRFLNNVDENSIGGLKKGWKEKSLKVQSEKSRDDLSNVNHRITYLGCCKAGSAFYWSLLSLPSPSLWVLLNLSATIFTRCNLSNGAKNPIVSRVSASLFGHRLHTLYLASQNSISHLK